MGSSLIQMILTDSQKMSRKKKISGKSEDREKDTGIKHRNSIPTDLYSNKKPAFQTKKLIMSLKSKYLIPSKSDTGGTGNESCVYLCANSIGLQPRSLKKALDVELGIWATKGSLGHSTHYIRNGWVSLDEEVSHYLAPIVGASDYRSVAAMNSLTTNIHMMLSSFYQPTENRFVVLMEESPFPSDYFAIKSFITSKGLNPENTIKFVCPRDQEKTIRTEDIALMIEKYKPALIWLPGVHFYTGQAFDMKTITKLGHDSGAIVGWDLAHAVGNLQLKLDDWGVDFACWCSYKYLGAGPGGIGGVYVHPQHWELNYLKGWWGQKLESRMRLSYEDNFRQGALALHVSNPSVLDNVCLLESLKMIQEYGGMEAVRKESIRLTSLLERGLQTIPSGINIITPSDPESRGAQITIEFDSSETFKNAVKRLEIEGVVIDKRDKAIRVAPFPLYNDDDDIDAFVSVLRKSLS
ncbi:hypothetical protein KL906_002858 [Ogataea polymorpha]|nr:hypothetical protein KL906_002858 [Ogataea polymorpha]KAG7915902.1 hypothetical protein KL927_003367 [Ogataea polymorpha]